jgi:uncharacterized protein YPO0396
MLEPTPRKFTPEEHAQLVQIQARQAGRELDARLAASEIALRQWCVEQACKSPDDYIDESATVVSVAESILDFVTAPLKPEQPK